VLHPATQLPPTHPARPPLDHTGGIAVAGEPETTVDGRVIDNPLSGERIVIRASAAQTGGQLLAFDLFLPPGGHVPARHVHPQQEERFTVLDGRMRFQLGRRSHVLQAGESVAVPAGTAHWFGNPGPGQARTLVEVRPALRMQELLEASQLMSQRSHLPGTRLPSPSALARILLEFHSELSVPHVPPFVLRSFLTPLVWLSRVCR
jgi:quercetin dioxygenase-like cupin family protein